MTLLSNGIINISATTSVTEDFEDGLGAWTVYQNSNNNPSLEQVTDRPYNGTYSGYSPEAPSGSGEGAGPCAERTLFSGGAQPTTIDYYWQEQSQAEGHALRFVNSNGGTEFSTASNNPQWETESAAGRTDHHFPGETYDAWIHVDVSLDWANGTFSVTWTRQSDGETHSTGSLSFVNAVDIEGVEIWGYGTGTFGDGRDPYAWFDDIYASE